MADAAGGDRRGGRRGGRGRGGRRGGRGRGGASGSAAPARAAGGAAAATAAATSTTAPLSAAQQFMTKSTFASLPVAEPIKAAIREVMGYECMTAVQEASIPVSLKGGDVLAKAKTGTGKTLAFLIPTVHRLLTRSGAGRGIQALVLSPTRELASQIAEEAKKLLAKTTLKVACVVGGTNVNADLNRMRGAHLLVATPGRCLDLLSNYGLSLESTHTFILDEADRMLDMGFQPDLLRIMEFVPADRQTLLFSATVPDELHGVVHIAFTQAAGHEFVDCVGDAEEVHAHVKQHWCIVPQERQLAAVARLLDHHCATVPNYKIMVFFSTARVCGYVADLFEATRRTVLQLHSRKSQGYRTRVANQFRDSSGGVILFSSDVSARGVDYPGVTLVIQVGITSKEQYIHRLGRTARAGAGGQGWLVLLPDEIKVKHQLSSLLDDDQHELPPPTATGFEADLPAALRSVPKNGELRRSGNAAYAAWLGFYNSNSKYTKWSKTELVKQAAHFAEVCGLPETPILEAKTVGKMGLKGTPGLRIAGKNGEPQVERNGGGRGGGRGGRGGRGGQAGTKRGRY